MASIQSISTIGQWCCSPLVGSESPLGITAGFVVGVSVVEVCVACRLVRVDRVGLLGGAVMIVSLFESMWLEEGEFAPPVGGDDERQGAGTGGYPVLICPVLTDIGQ